ncbi:MAG: hypothetical protein LC737_08560 [Chloroflexi bacterium]|nr:hypothetical protein [Chloroflexota bacterium]
MRNALSPSLGADSVGLCRTCLNHRVITSSKGSNFYLCALSERDPRFPKYPRLPVVRCDGYDPIKHDH